MRRVELTNRGAQTMARAAVWHGDSRGDVMRSCRGEGETAGADHAANCSRDQETSPRRIYGPCLWVA
jgi:hypothetical protein